MNNKPIFYDTDCLSSFICVGRVDLLKNFYSQIIISSTVEEEFFNANTPKDIKSQLEKLIDENFVIVKELEIDSKEFNYYYSFITSSEGNEGEGELTTIALAIVNKGIIASNNLKDVCKYIKKFNLPHITTAVILVNSVNEKCISFDEASDIWRDMIKNGIYLPKNSFEEYYKYSLKDDLCFNQYSNKKKW